MGFIDTMRAEGHAVESTCRVLREQGCRVAARTYRAWKSPTRVIAARTHSDAVVIDAIHAVCTTTGPDGHVKATPESLYWAAQDDRPAAPVWAAGRGSLHRRPGHENPWHERRSTSQGGTHHDPSKG